MADDLLRSVIGGEIEAEEVVIGKGVVVEPGVVIRGRSGKAEKIVLGDFCYIGEGVKIMAPEFYLGDYSKLHAGCFCHGVNPLRIGRNCWIGGQCVLDSMGGLDIDDNVGIGAHSQIWTHMQFGDIVEGCRFYSRKYMHIGKDAWFVGHCIVYPVKVGEKSMALAGSVVRHDMLSDHVYGGNPARDATERTGPQFHKWSSKRKAMKLESLIQDFVGRRPEFINMFHVAMSPEDRIEGVTNFDVSQRTYTQTYSDAEVAFLKEFTPLIKFVPEGKPRFYEAGDTGLVDDLFTDSDLDGNDHEQ